MAQCLPCTAGQYCEQEHLDNPTGPCLAGHFCAYGVDRQQPDGNNDTCPAGNNATCPYYDGHQSGYGGVCPVGHYCPTGTTLPIPCPNGTYAEIEGMAECETCKAGRLMLGVASPFPYRCRSCFRFKFDVPDDRQSTSPKC